jgi:hypothetical protein
VVMRALDLYSDGSDQFGRFAKLNRKHCRLAALRMPLGRRDEVFGVRVRVRMWNAESCGRDLTRTGKADEISGVRSLESTKNKPLGMEDRQGHG